MCQHKEGRGCLFCLNASRRVFHLPPLEELPEKKPSAPETPLAWVAFLLFANLFLWLRYFTKG